MFLWKYFYLLITTDNSFLSGHYEQHKEMSEVEIWDCIILGLEIV